MGFFSSLFGGDSKGLDSSIANAGNIMNFSTNLGEKDLTAGSNFYNDILSGDPTKIGALLGPQISTIQEQGQQQLNTTAEFGNRSGGTNAAGQTNMDSQRQNVEQMIAQLTGQAAQGVTGIGEDATSTALSANLIQAKEAELQQQNQENSIFGGLISGGISSLADFGMGKLTDWLNSFGGGGNSSTTTAPSGGGGSGPGFDF